MVKVKTIPANKRTPPNAAKGGKSKNPKPNKSLSSETTKDKVTESKKEEKERVEKEVADTTPLKCQNAWRKSKPLPSVSSIFDYVDDRNLTDEIILQENWGRPLHTPVDKLMDHLLLSLTHREYCMGDAFTNSLEEQLRGLANMYNMLLLGGLQKPISEREFREWMKTKTTMGATMQENFERPVEAESMRELFDSNTVERMREAYKEVDVKDLTTKEGQAKVAKIHSCEVRIGV